MPAAQTPPPAPVAEGNPGELVPIEITWDGVGPLYKSFFQERKALTALSETLAPWVNGPVQMHVTWNQAEFLGGIRILLPPGSLKQRPRLGNGDVDLASLAPITAALATYRDAVSGQFDVRIQSFVVGLDFFRGPVHCRVGIAGEPPFDGRTVSPCPLLNGEERCGRPVSGAVHFDELAFLKLEKCLES